MGPLHSTIIKLSKFGTHNLLRSLVLMRLSLLKPVSQTTELVTTHKKTLMRNRMSSEKRVTPSPCPSSSMRS